MPNSPLFLPSTNRAARFVLGRKSGLFGMDQVLGLAAGDAKTMAP